jgi:predicted ATPase/class 3 adenylate cyclase
LLETTAVRAGRRRAELPRRGKVEVEALWRGSRRPFASLGNRLFARYNHCVEYRILGPLEVTDGENEISLGAPKQRTLVGVLLLHANEVVSSARLIDELWGERPPPTAGKTLQTYVSQLRKAVGADTIVTRTPGYVLRIEADALDASQFHDLARDAHRLAASGEHARAAALYREALALWRGPPLADVSFESFARSEVEQLEEQRLGALMDRIDCELALGCHDELVAELETLVRRHPLRERLRAQLMLALYRSGRQADALAAYQDARRTLDEQLGLVPGPELKELEQAILRQDASLEATARGRSRVPEPVDSRPLQPAREVRKVVSVLFADVVDSTELGGSRDPEAVRRVMIRWYEEMRAVIERHGGAIEKFGGDEVMAVFGVPLVHEDDALRAVRAAMEMRERLAALNEELEARRGMRLEARLGINTGVVVAGHASSGQTFVTGGVVNLARRLEQAAAPGQILLGERTYQLVRDAVTAERLVSVAVKGLRAPVTPFRLEEIHAHATGRARRLGGPMVGRERELRLLRDAFERCVGDQRCQLLTVLGIAGVGKSRLVAEFVQLLDANVLHGRCLHYGEGSTYWPLAEVVREAARLRGDEAPAEARTRIEAVLDAVDGAPVAERVAQLLGLATATGSADEMHWAARKLLEAVARGRPLVLVFEDVEHAEADFLDFVEHVADVSRDRPILVVCVARPELLEARPSWGGGKFNAASILLEPLGDVDTTRLVERLLDGELDPRATARIVEAAEGIPLFAEEYVAMLVDDGLLERRGAHWQAAIDLSAVHVPPTIHALLAARIDQLTASDRAVLERAAVEGRTFHRGAVVALMDDASEDQIGRCLLSLVRQELIRPDRSHFADEEAYRFRHGLIRDAAYDSVPKERRADLHECFAQWLERKGGVEGGDSDEIPCFARWLEKRADAQGAESHEILGYHLERAFRYRAEIGVLDSDARALSVRAARYLALAGFRACSRGDEAAMAHLLERAVSLHPAGSIERGQLLPDLARALTRTGDFQRGQTVLAEAIEHARAAHDRPLELDALLAQQMLQNLTGRQVAAEQAIPLARRAISVFGEFGDHVGLARGWSEMSIVHHKHGKLAEAEHAAKKQIHHAVNAHDPRVTPNLGLLARIAAEGSASVHRGLQRCEELLAEARGPRAQASIYEARGEMRAMVGDFERAREDVIAAWRIAEELGLKDWAACMSMRLGDIELLAGNPAAAEETLLLGCEALEEIGDLGHLSSAAARLAKAIYEQGRYDEAFRATRMSQRAAADDDVDPQTLWRVTRAKVVARRGRLEHAERLAHEAVKMSEATDLLNLRAEALADLAEVLRLAGRHQEGAPILQRAIGLYEEKGNVVSAEKMRTRLDQLSITGASTL